MGNVEATATGNLQEKPAIFHFLDLACGTFKGVMIFARGSEKKSFIFEAGKPYFGNQSLQEPILGRALFEKNLMNSDQFKKIKEIEASGKTFFHALTEFNILPKELVLNVVLEQWIDDMAVVFSWDQGQFASVESFPKDVTKIEIPRSIHHYMMQASILKNKRVKNKYQPTTRFEILSIPPKGFTLDNLMLNGQEKKVHASFKQSKPIKTVALETSLNESIVGPIILAFRDMGLARSDADARKKEEVTSSKAIPIIANEEFSKGDELNFFSKVKNLDTLDYFEILDQKRDATAQDIQTAYFRLAKKYHPDRLKDKTTFPTKDAERFFAKITESYNTLSNPVLRKEYEFKNSKEAAAHGELMKKILASENIYLEGKGLLNRNMFAEAVEKIREAIALYDMEPEYFVNLGWALFRQGAKENKPAKIAEAKKLLVDSYKREYFLAEVSYYLGMISKHEGKTEQAINYFRKCISIENNHSLALSELRFLEKKGGKKK